MADSILGKANSALGKAKEAVIASAETTKTDVLKDAVDNVVSRGIDGAKTVVLGAEEKKGEVSSKIFGTVSNLIGSADSAATSAKRDLPVSTDNQQPLLAAGDRGVETATPWWKNCCGVLDLLKTSSSTTT